MGEAVAERRDLSQLHGRLWLAEALWKLGSIQFGDFSLGRTVRNSPVYVNAKLLISRPRELQRTAQLIGDELRMGQAMRNRQVEPFDNIAGVPIGGLHIATALSLEADAPLLYVRPSRAGSFEPSSHIEGIYTPGQGTVIVDDLAAGGGSLVETVERLREAGLRVHDAVVLIDREQGAAARLQMLGVRLHSVLTLDVILQYLHSTGHVDDEDFERSRQYLRREGDVRSEFD
jgi:orotate phosphoribosyltransferase